MIKKIYNSTNFDGRIIEVDNKKLLSLPNPFVAQVKERFCPQLRDIGKISIPEENIPEKPICDDIYDIRGSNSEYHLIFTNTNSGEIEDKIIVSPQELKFLLYC